MALKKHFAILERNLKTMTRRLLMGLGVLVSAVLAACTPPAGEPDLPVEDTSSDSAGMPVPPADGSGAMGEGTVYIDEVDVLILESFPMGATALVRGSFADGCTTLDRIETTRPDETTFEIVFHAVRPLDAACTLALVPFEESVSLDLVGLSTGTYTVKAGEAETTFELTVGSSAPHENLAPGCVTLNGYGLLLNPEDGYCVSFPAEINPQTEVPGVSRFDGELVSRGAPPNRASLVLELIGPAKGQDARAFAEVELPEARWGPYSSALIDGEEAVLIEKAPGQAFRLVAFVVHNDRAYRITLDPSPSDPDADPAVIESAEALWRGVAEGLTWLPVEG
jgi:inhibitor of cysteine peptidase